MKLVFGLGNPGPDYVGTRHNVGFEVLAHLARHEGLLFRPGRDLEGHSGPRAFRFAESFDPAALLVCPETFMNRSGEVVAAVARSVARRGGVAAGGAGHAPGAPPLPPILVVHDDLDLDVGVVRLRPRGGHGGHNGMRSILAELGTDDFPRVRVGVGRPATDAVRHVLGRFDPRERTEIDVSVAEAAEAIGSWLRSGDFAECVARFHSRWAQGGPARPAPARRPGDTT